MDTTSFNRNPPKKHLLHGQHIIYSNLASKVLIVSSEKNSRSCKVPYEILSLVVLVPQFSRPSRFLGRNTSNSIHLPYFFPTIVNRAILTFL